MDATGHGEFADGKSILEDTEDNRTRALSATGGTDDHKSSLVQWFYQLGTVSASVRRDCVVERVRRCDCGTAVVVTSSGGCPKCGTIDADAPPGFQEGTDGCTIVSLWIARSVGNLPPSV